jgi:hypothetical protein
METKFQAVMRLSDAQSMNSDYINRYALIGNNVADAIEMHLDAKSKTPLGKIWCFDPQSSDPDIRRKSQDDIEWFKAETGQDLTRYLPVGTPIVLSSVDVPVHYFLTGKRVDASLYTDKNGVNRIHIERDADTAKRFKDLRAEARAERLELRAAGFSAEDAKEIRKESYKEVLIERLRAKTAISTPTVNLSELDFSKINFGAVPDLTPPASEPTAQDISADFSTPADNADDTTKA